MVHASAFVSRLLRRAGLTRVAAGPLGMLLGLGLLTAPTAIAQVTDDGIALWRDQFAEAALAPAQALREGGPTVLRDERWRVAGVDTLRVESGDPEVTVVFRLAPAGAETAALRLRVIVLPNDGALRYRYRQTGTVLQAEGTGPQRRFRVGDQGLRTALAGATGQVAEIVVQDDGDAELQVRRDGTTLVLDVIPPTLGGSPSGTRPYFLGAPLKFTEYGLLASGYTDNLLGELWLGGRVLGRANLLFSDAESVTLLRGLATAQAWRSQAWALWAEGGAALLRVERAGVTTQTVRATGGVALHWRHGPWGAAVQAGVLGLAENTALALLGGWQAWDWLGVVLSWQQLEGRSGFGLGAALSF